MVHNAWFESKSRRNKQIGLFMQPAPGQIWRSVLNNTDYEILSQRPDGNWLYANNNGWDLAKDFENGALVFIAWAPGKGPPKKTRLELILEEINGTS